jgi:hypothetical protein
MQDTEMQDTGCWMLDANARCELILCKKKGKYGFLLGRGLALIKYFITYFMKNR